MKEIKTEALYHPRKTGKQDVSLQAAAWSFSYGSHKQVIFYTFIILIPLFFHGKHSKLIVPNQLLC